MGKGRIKRIITECNSHAEAERENIKFYRALSNRQRLEIALELMSGLYEAYPRFERVYRTAELGECPVSSDWRKDLSDVKMLKR